MYKNVKAYKGTAINWAKSQAQIMKVDQSWGIAKFRPTTGRFLFPYQFSEIRISALIALKPNIVAIWGNKL